MGDTGTKLTYEDYVLIPEDGKRHEIVGGEHFVTPAPMLYHQKVTGRLFRRLSAAIEDRGSGEVLIAPVDVQLSAHDIVQPDVVVVLAAQKRILTPTKIKGAPDLLIEVLSASNREHDRTRKKRLYERSGVREFWLVDPNEHSVEQFTLADRGYGPAETHSDSISLRVLPDLTVDLSGIW